jgi:ankyrin repeat protein
MFKKTELTELKKLEKLEELEEKKVKEILVNFEFDINKVIEIAGENKFTKSINYILGYLVENKEYIKLKKILIFSIKKENFNYIQSYVVDNVYNLSSLMMDIVAEPLLCIAVMSSNDYIVEILMNNPKTLPDKELLLYRAAEEGHSVVVKKLRTYKELNLNWVYNLPDMTPLHIATKKGHLDVVNALLDKGEGGEEGAKLDIETSTTETPLFIAAQYGHLDIVNEMLDKGANPDGPNTLNLNLGNTPLFIAVKIKNLEIVKALLNKEADPNIINKLTGMNPYLEIVKSLLNKEADPNIINTSTGMNPLHFAVLKNDLEVVEALLDVEKTEIEKKTTIDMDWTEYFTEKVSTLNVRVYTSLYIAVYLNYYDIANHLISKGAKVDDDILDISNKIVNPPNYIHLNRLQKKSDNTFPSNVENAENINKLLKSTLSSNTVEGLNIRKKTSQKGKKKKSVKRKKPNKKKKSVKKKK